MDYSYQGLLNAQQYVPYPNWRQSENIDDRQNESFYKNIIRNFMTPQSVADAWKRHLPEVPPLTPLAREAGAGNLETMLSSYGQAR